MDQVHGIEASKKVIDLGLQLVKSGLKVAEDGQIGLSDIQELVPVIMSIAANASAIGQVGAEVADYTAEEVLELGAHVAAKLALPNEKAQQVAMAALKVGVAGVELVKAIKA